MHIIDAHVYLGEGRHLSLSVDNLLKNMDKTNISLAIACAPDRYLAIHNKAGNDLIIDAVRKHPDRIVGMASVNPWYEEAGLREIRRALTEGLKGLMLHAGYQGFRLSDHIVDPFIEVAAEFDVPVYAHTGTAGIAEPFHVVELARRFPEVNFMMGHAGASDYGEDAVRALEFVENVWLETSRNGPANFGLWKVNACFPRVVFGSSAPEYIPEIEIETLCDVITEKADREAVFSRNIQRVFKGGLLK